MNLLMRLPDLSSTSSTLAIEFITWLSKSTHCCDGSTRSPEVSGILSGSAWMIEALPLLLVSSTMARWHSYLRVSMAHIVIRSAIRSPAISCPCLLFSMRLSRHFSSGSMFTFLSIFFSGLQEEPLQLFLVMLVWDFDVDSLY